MVSVCAFALRTIDPILLGAVIQMLVRIIVICRICLTGDDLHSTDSLSFITEQGCLVQCYVRHASEARQVGAVPEAHQATGPCPSNLP